MVSKTTWVAIVLIAGFILLGVAQNMNLPHSGLAGAATNAPKTQEEINGCMKDCMRSCVTIEGTELGCTDSCTTKCVPA